MRMAIVIMGVSGSGKSTVGTALAEALGWPFLEADDLHSKENKEKMSKGIPLTDKDRLPWLESLRAATAKHMASGNSVVLSCSALQRIYREILRQADSNYRATTTGGDCSICRVRFVCLEIARDVVTRRVLQRAEEGSHFMPSSLVDSQFQLLQIDDDEGIIRVDAALGLEEIVAAIRAQLHFGSQM